MGYYGFTRNSGIIRFRDYAHALSWFEDTKPIRGRTPELRPLGHRRNTWYSIQQGEQGEIKCIQYDLPIVTFHKNGEVELKDYAYRTTSTANFLYEVTGLNAFIHDKSLVVCIGNQQYRVPDPREGSLIIKREESGNYHFVRGGVERATHTLNRKGKKEVMARYKPQFDYIRSMAKLREGEVITNNLHRWNEEYNSLDDPIRSRNFKGYINNFRMYLDDPNPNSRMASWAEAMEILAKDYGNYSYRHHGREVSYEKLVYGLEQVLMGIYRDEVFTATPVGIGEVKRDRYATYFGRGWNEFHG